MKKKNNNEFTLTTPKKKESKQDSLEWNSFKEETANKTVTNSFIEDMVSRSKGLIEAISKKKEDVSFNENNKMKTECLSEIEMTKIFSPRRKRSKIDSLIKKELVVNKSTPSKKNESKIKNEDAVTDKLCLKLKPIKKDSKIKEESKNDDFKFSKEELSIIKTPSRRSKIIKKNENLKTDIKINDLELKNNSIDNLNTKNISLNDGSKSSVKLINRKKKIIPEVLNAMKTLEDLEKRQKAENFTNTENLKIKKNLDEIIELDSKIKNENIITEKNRKINELSSENIKLKAEIVKLRQKNEKIIKMGKIAEQNLQIEVQKNLSREIPIELDLEEKKRLGERGIFLVQKLCDDFQQTKDDLNKKYENIKLEMRGLNEEVFAYKNMVKELLKKIKNQKNADELIKEIKKELS